MKLLLFSVNQRKTSKACSPNTPTTPKPMRIKSVCTKIIARGAQPQNILQCLPLPDKLINPTSISQANSTCQEAFCGVRTRRGLGRRRKRRLSVFSGGTGSLEEGAPSSVRTRRNVSLQPPHRREFCIAPHGRWRDAPLLPMEGGGQELCGREDGRESF